MLVMKMIMMAMMMMIMVMVQEGPVYWKARRAEMVEGEHTKSVSIFGSMIGILQMLQGASSYIYGRSDTLLLKVPTFLSFSNTILVVAIVL